jgi:hypothetical protein
MRRAPSLSGPAPRPVAGRARRDRRAGRGEVRCGDAGAATGVGEGRSWPMLEAHTRLRVRRQDAAGSLMPRQHLLLFLGTRSPFLVDPACAQGPASPGPAPPSHCGVADGFAIPPSRRSRCSARTCDCRTDRTWGSHALPSRRLTFYELPRDRSAAQPGGGAMIGAGAAPPRLARRVSGARVPSVDHVVARVR